MRKFLLILILISAGFGFGQEGFPNSIKDEAPETYRSYSEFIRSFNQGDHVEALTSLDSTIYHAGLELSGDYSVLAILEYCKAIVLLESGSIVEAEGYLRSVLEAYEDGERKNEDGEGRLLLALARVEYTGLNFERSIITGKKAVSKISDYRVRASAYSHLTQCFTRIDQRDSAIFYARKTVEAMESSGDTTSFDYITDNLNLIVLLSEESQRKECVEVLNHVRRISEKMDRYLTNGGAHPSSIGGGYLLLSNVCFDCNYYEQGMFYARKVLSSTKNIKSGEVVYSSALNEIIKSQILYGTLDSAAYYIQQFIPLQRSHFILENALLTEAEKDVYLNRKNNGQNHCLTVLEMRGNVDSEYNKLAYSHAVFLKGFALRSLSNLQKALYEEADSLLHQSFEEWLGLRELYYQNLRFSDHTGLNLDSVKNEMDNLEKNFYRITKLNVQNGAAENPDWNTIKASLGKGELVVDFVRYHKHNELNQWKYGAFVFHSESTFPEYFELCFETELGENLKRNHLESEFRYINRIYGSESPLYDLIWNKIITKYGDKNRIYISCTGLLHGISHDAVLDTRNNRDRGQPEVVLINSSANLQGSERADINLTDAEVMLFGGVDYDLPSDHEVIVGDSSSVYDQTRGRNTGNWGKLEHTKTEIQSIEKMISERGGRTISYYGSEASEVQFKQAVRSHIPAIVHIATHGYFLNDTTPTISPSQTLNYTRSGMVMAGANDCYKSQSEILGYGDGVLTAPEISSLNLSGTKLVVLSACQTGLGDLNNIGNAYGLQRAFKIAGADYIIYSLWKVSDEVTMKFMTTFYQNLLENSNVRAAFYATKNEIKANYSVFYWAPFQLIN